MSNAYRCDRCDKCYNGYNLKELFNNDYVNGLTLCNRSIGNEIESCGQYDLCPNCMRKFLKFMHIEYEETNSSTTYQN